MNAFTARDQTCYIISAAGYEGFKTIGSNYLNSMFFPILNDENFITEVHHINGRGEDAGVVYSEMQGVENQPNTLIYNQQVMDLYGKGNSYSKITGGKLSNLRENITIDQIRQYHKTYYQLRNTYIAVVGKVSPEQVKTELLKMHTIILISAQSD